MTGNAQIAHETPMPFRLTVAVLMLDIVTEWTLNASLTTSSSYRKCSNRRTLDHSAQATSLLQIEGTTRCSRTALGLSCGSILAYVADLSLPSLASTPAATSERRMSVSYDFSGQTAIVTGG